MILKYKNSLFDKTYTKLMEQVFVDADYDDPKECLVKMPNGKTKRELYDNPSYVVFKNFTPPNSTNSKFKGKLCDALNYPELFKKVPCLSNINCDFTIDSTLVNGVGEEGYYSHAKRLIYLKYENWIYFVMTLFHEVQHAIQNLCNHDVGGDPRRCNPSLDVGDIKIVDFYENFIKNKINLANATTSEEIKAKNEFEKIISTYYNQEYSKQIMHDANLNIISLQYFTYMNLIGEIEAREVERRVLYNLEDKRLIKPNFIIRKNQPQLSS